MILAAACFCDLRSDRVPNWIIGIGLGGGVFFQIFMEEGNGVFYFLAGIGFPVMLFSVLFLFRMMGAGDIKLFSVIGGLLGVKAVSYCIMAAFIVGAVIGFMKLVHYHILWSRLQYLVSYLSQFMRTKKVVPYRSCEEQKTCLIHFTIPIGIGTAWYLGGM